MGKEEDAEISKDPTLVESYTGVSSAACGSSHSAFIVDGKLYAYGSNKHKQLGHQEASVGEVEFDGGAAISQVELGGHHSVAISEAGQVWTWGWGGSFWSGAGALGHGSKDEQALPKLVETMKGKKVVQVACGDSHTIALTDEGRLFSTGKGDYGRLGLGDTSDELEFEEIDYFDEAKDSVLAPDERPKIKKVDAGNSFSAVMSDSGELWVWGRNDHGQLGLGEEAMGEMYSAERFPRLVSRLAKENHKVIDFACGETHIVVLTEAGMLFEWGRRTWLEPHAVAIPEEHKDSLADIVKLAAGEKFSMALTKDGTLYTWGAKSTGCLAQGAQCAKMLLEPTPVPAETFGHQKVVDMAARKTRCLAITLEDTHK